MRRAVLISSPAAWEHGHGLNHPLKPERLRRTVELLSEYGALATACAERSRGHAAPGRRR